MSTDGELAAAAQSLPQTHSANAISKVQTQTGENTSLRTEHEIIKRLQQNLQL